MKVIIDRFEGDFAVVETPDKKFFNLPRQLVPNGEEGNVISIEIDISETKARHDNIERLMRDVWKD